GTSTDTLGAHAGRKGDALPFGRRRGRRRSAPNRPHPVPRGRPAGSPGVASDWTSRMLKWLGSVARAQWDQVVVITTTKSRPTIPIQIARAANDVVQVSWRGAPDVVVPLAPRLRATNWDRVILGQARIAQPTSRAGP